MDKYELSLAISLIAGILTTLGVYVDTDAETAGILIALVFWVVMIPTAMGSLILKREYSQSANKVHYWDTVSSFLWILASFTYSTIMYYPTYFNLLYGNFFNFLKIITPILIVFPLLQIIYLLFNKTKWK